MGAIHNHLEAAARVSSKPVPWTRVDPRRVADTPLVKSFTAVAPQQLVALTAAVSKRDIAIARASALALSESLDAIGARGLSQLLEALRADITAGDWLLVDARVATVESYFEVVRATLAARARRHPFTP